MSDAENVHAFSKMYKDPNFTLHFRKLLLNVAVEEDEFISSCLYQIFQNKIFQGERLLDVGCGPTVHRIAAASAFFSEIVVSDFSENNVEDVQKWLEGKSLEENWDPLFQTQALLEGHRCIDDGINEIKSRIREKVKQVLPCDVLRKEIIQEDVGKFDVLLSSMCLESACTTVESYKSAIENLSEYILPGGGLVMVLAVENPFYFIEGMKKIYCLSVSEELLNESLKETGFKKKDYFFMKSSETKDIKGIAVISAIKM